MTIREVTATNTASRAESSPPLKRKVTSDSPVTIDSLNNIVSPLLTDSCDHGAIDDLLPSDATCANSEPITPGIIGLEEEGYYCAGTMQQFGTIAPGIGSRNIERTLRDILREGLAHASTDDDESEEEKDCCTEVTAAPTFSVTEYASEYSQRSAASRRMLSEEEDCEELDIYDPDFWYTDQTPQVGVTRRCGREKNPDYIVSNKATRTTKDKRSKEDCSASIQAFLQSRGYEISSSDSDDNNDDINNASILSDITGITELFESSSKACHPNIITAKPKVARQRRQSWMKTSASLSSVDAQYLAGTLHRNQPRSPARAKSSAPTSYSHDEGIDVSPRRLPRSPVRKRSKVAGRQVKTVTFSNVSIRHYERILCDNPSCSMGPSIGIGWQFVSQEPMTLDAWEDSKRQIKSPSELLLSRSQRETLIRYWGYTDRQIASTVRELNKLRAARRQTVNNLSLKKWEEAIESVRGQVKKILFLH